jgi:hypothetical protein
MAYIEPRWALSVFQERASTTSCPPLDNFLKLREAIDQSRWAKL